MCLQDDVALMRSLAASMQEAMTTFEEGTFVRFSSLSPKDAVLADEAKIVPLFNDALDRIPFARRDCPFAAERAITAAVAAALMGTTPPHL